MLADAYDTRVLQQLDDLQVQLAEEQAELQQLLVRLVGGRGARSRRAASTPWYGADAFNAHFRGAADDITSRYRDLAARFVGCGPVLDIGFGRGEFLELLARASASRRAGSRADPRSSSGRGCAGCRPTSAARSSTCASSTTTSLGGLVMIQVIEHLSPQHVIDVVRLAAEKVRPGGRVVVETVNPTSLYTYAHAFWVDPDHVRPGAPELPRVLVRRGRLRRRSSASTVRRCPPTRASS